MQNNTKYIIPCLLCAMFLNNCGQRPTAKTDQNGAPQLLILSSLIGYVEPCGCTIDLHLGGLARIAQLVELERAKAPTALVVVGPFLFEKAVKEHRRPQESRKAKLLTKAFKALKVDAVVGTGSELFQGRKFYENLMGDSFADVTANTPNGRPKIVEIGPLKLGLAGLVKPGTYTPTGFSTPPEAAIKTTVANLKASGAHAVVVLAHLPRRQIRLLAKRVTGVDLWVLSHKPKEETEAQPVTGGYMVEAGDRGRNLGRISFFDADKVGPIKDPIGDAKRGRKIIEGQIQMNRFTLMRTGEASIKTRISALENTLANLSTLARQGRRFEYELLPVKAHTPRAEPFAEWVDTYNRELKTLNLTNAGAIKPVASGQSRYLGRAECVDCHPEADAFWQKTKHAKAWATLVKAEKTFDSECVGCHVTGWQKPGGTILGKTEKLTDVQCEVCHGPGSRHVDSGGDATLIQRNVPKTRCFNCHNEHHSPKFNYDTYVRRITGQGHARRSVTP
jgi:hypothetical protein